MSRWTVVVAVDGASSAPAGRLRRLLRRGLLIAGLAAAGWLLSVLFATSASATDHPSGPPPAPAKPTEQPAAPGTAPATTPADEPATTPGEEPGADPGSEPGSDPSEPPATDPANDPATEPATAPGAEPAELPATEPGVDPGDGSVAQPSDDAAASAGAVSSVLDATYTVTYSVHQLSQTVTTVVAAAAHAEYQTVAEMLAVHSAPPQSRLDTEAPSAATRATPRPAAHPAPPATPAPRAGVILMAEHTARAPAAETPRRAPGRHLDTREHADKHGPGAPATPPAPAAPGGTSVSNAHDNAGGARGTHGVLTAAATLPPPSAGLTTRSRAADVGGRVAGLPATSPD